MRNRGLQVWAVFLLFLSACGGGNSGNSTSPPPQQSDTTPPVISLNGNENIELLYAENYVEQGATANDDRDGTVDVTISGEVDIYQSGEYILTYSASDLAGNRSSVTRSVHVSPKNVQLTISKFGALSLVSGVEEISQCDVRSDFCTVSIPAGTTITIDANPDSNWNFLYWRGCDNFTARNCEVTIDDDRTIFATAESVAPLEISNDVHVLTTEQYLGFVSFNPANGNIVLTSGTDLTRLEPGNIIISPTAAPEGGRFMRRVLSLSTSSNNDIIITTTIASISDAISSGTLIYSPANFTTNSSNKHDYFSGGLSTSQIEVLSLAKGVSVSETNSKAELEITFSLDELEIYEKGDLEVEAFGEVTVRFDPEFAVSKKTFLRPDSIRWTLTGETVGEITLSASGELLEFLDKKIDIAELRFTAFAIGPFVFTGTADVYFDVEGEINVAVRPTFNFDYGVTGGFHWTEESGTTLLSDFFGNFEFELLETIGAYLELEGGVYLEPSIKLFDIVGPFVSIGVSGLIEGVASPFAECPILVDAYGGVHADAGGELEFGPFEAEISVFPFSKYHHLATIPESCEPDTEAPSDPISVIATSVSNTEIELSWDAASDNVGVSTYEIWRRDADFDQALYLTETRSLTYLDHSLTSGNNYCYYILARDASGNRSNIPNQLACATTPTPETSSQVPTPTISFLEAQSHSNIVIEWTIPENATSVSKYLIYDTSDTNVDGYIVGQTPHLTYNVTGLRSDTRYCFAVAAVDQSSNRSELSNEACDRTGIDPESSNGQFVYTENFDSDPGWITDQSANYYWNAENKTFFARASMAIPDYGPNRYAYIPIPLNTTESFSVSWDQRYLKRNGTAISYFGLMNDSLSSSKKQFVNDEARLFVQGFGARSGVNSVETHQQRRAVTSGGTVTSGGGSSANAALIEMMSDNADWFNHNLEYSKDTKSIKYTIFRQGESEPIYGGYSVELRGTGEFSTDMINLGFGLYPLGVDDNSIFSQEPDAYLEIEIDNIEVKGVKKSNSEKVLIDFEEFGRSDQFTLIFDQIIFESIESVRTIPTDDIRTTFIAGIDSANQDEAILVGQFQGKANNLTFDIIREDAFDSYIDIVYGGGQSETVLLPFDHSIARTLLNPGTGMQTIYIIPVDLSDYPDVEWIRFRPNDGAGMGYDNFSFDFSPN